MSEIKVGDIVRRIASVHCGMAVGDIATVSDVWAGNFGTAISLDGFTGTHLSENFEIVTKQKTVADAYEAFSGEWPDDSDNYIYYFCNEMEFRSRCYDWKCSEKSYKVCTREQFEAYAKEQEVKQEGEKWTHTYNGDVCRIVHQVDGDAWIKFKALLGALVVRADKLKPIKTKLTKAQAWDKICEGLGEDEIRDTYDIV